MAPNDSYHGELDLGTVYMKGVSESKYRGCTFNRKHSWNAPTMLSEKGMSCVVHNYPKSLSLFRPDLVS